jgi:uncharacterized RDD family membrane protein YckC
MKTFMNGQSIGLDLTEGWMDGVITSVKWAVCVTQFVLGVFQGEIGDTGVAQTSQVSKENRLELAARPVEERVPTRPNPAAITRAEENDETPGNGLAGAVGTGPIDTGTSELEASTDAAATPNSSQTNEVPGIPLSLESNQEVVQIKSPIWVRPGDKFRDVVVILSDATIEGEVSGDVVVVGGEIRIRGEGIIRGDVVNIGSGINMDPDVQVEGDLVAIGGGVRGLLNQVSGEVVQVRLDDLAQSFSQFELPPRGQAFVDECLAKLRPLSLRVPWVLWVLLIWTASHGLLLLLMPGTASACRRELYQRPGTAFVVGMLVVPMLLFFLLTLVSMVITIPLIPFLLLGLLAMEMIGKNGLLQFIGGRLTGQAYAAGGTFRWVPWLVGVGVIAGFYLVPILGFVAWLVFASWSLGAATLAIVTSLSPVPVPPTGEGYGANDGSNPVSKPPVNPSGMTYVAGPGGVHPAQPSPQTHPPQAHPKVSETKVDPEVSPVPATGLQEAAPAGYPALLAGDETKSYAIPQSDPSGPALASSGGPSIASEKLGETTAATGESAMPHEAAQGRGSAQSSSPRLGETTSRTPDWGLPRVGLGRRLLASVLDLFVVGFLTLFLPEFLHWLKWPLIVGYFAGLWSARGTTVGGLLLSIRIVRLDGRPLDFSTALVRSLGTFLGLLPLGLGYFWCAWDAEQQAWQDKLAGTIVVRDEKIRSLV